MGACARPPAAAEHLLGNAVKFTDAGAVVLTLAHADGALEVRVRDTGPGIALEAQARLFRRFEQVDASPPRRRGGTGLGLAISREIVAAMGGRIGVESAPGEGTTLRVEVPAPITDPPSEAHAELAAATGPLRVLVADDNAPNRAVLEGFLRRMGHARTSVADGAAAVEVALAGDVDLVLMDLQMPVMDGLEAARAIKARAGPRRPPPIIAVTADGTVGARGRLAAAGMDGHVAKPVAPAALAEAIADAVWHARTKAPTETPAGTPFKRASA